MKHIGSVSVGLVVAIVFACCCYALESRANPQAPARNGTTRKQKVIIDPSCGTTDDLSKKVAVCAKPLMDLLQGSVEQWPRSEADAMKLCESFAWSERCIREQSRKCAQGIQKTIISTLANSISRARKRECGKSKAPQIVKTTMCLEHEQKTLHNWMGNVTARLGVIENQFIGGDKKLNGLCCIINDIQKEIKLILEPKCKEESKLIERLFRSVLEDVLELICRSPKCTDYLKGYKVPKQGEFAEVIAILLRIVFSLDAIN